MKLPFLIFILYYKEYQNLFNGQFLENSYFGNCFIKRVSYYLKMPKECIMFLSAYKEGEGKLHHKGVFNEEIPGFFYL